MSYKTVMMTRQHGGDIVPQYVLEKCAADMLAKGVIEITDLDGDKHDAEVLKAEVTERGVEVELNVSATMGHTLVSTPPPRMSMGCTVEARIPTGIPELDEAMKDGIPPGEIGKFYGKFYGKE